VNALLQILQQLALSALHANELLQNLQQFDLRIAAKPSKPDSKAKVASVPDT